MLVWYYAAMKQKIINVLGFVVIGLNILLISAMAYVYYQHQHYKELRLENNTTYPKYWKNMSHHRCHESNIWDYVFNDEK